MKKIKRITAILLMAATLCGCSNKYTYEDGAYNRTQSYDCAFQTETTTAGDNEFSFEKNQFTEDEKNDVIRHLLANRKQIEHALQGEIEIPNEQLHFYIVNSLNAEEPIIDGNVVFLDRDTWQSDSANVSMLRAMLDSYASIKLHGLMAYVLETPSQPDALVEYVNNHPEVLDFFYGRLNLNYVSEEERTQFLNVINGFSRFLIERNGLKEFWISEISWDDVQDWLKDSGVSVDVTSMGEQELLANLEADYMQNYEICLFDDEIEYSFANCAAYFEDVNEMANLLKKDRYVRMDIERYFKNNGLEEWGPQADVNHIRYDIVYDATGQAGHANASNLDAPLICIPIPRELMMTHEFLHVWLASKEKLPDRYWLEEGLCEYFAHIVYGPERICEGLYNSLDDNSYENGEYAQYYYMKRTGDVSADNFDLRVAYDYYAYKQVVCHEKTDASDAKPSSLGAWSGEGDDLSYVATQSFATYLVDKYGLSTVVQFLEGNATYAETFGESYKALKTEWMDYLKIESNNV